MEAERRTIDGADLGAAVQRAQMVTSALSLGANVWGKGAAKVGSLLHRWIGRLQTPLVKLRNAAGGKEVSLQVSVKGVTIGITW